MRDIALFKLLGDGKVHAGDANMNKLELYYAYPQHNP